MKSVELVGKTKEEALEEALRQLGTTIENVEVEYDEQKSGGIFGFLAKKEYRVKVTLLEPTKKEHLKKDTHVKQTNASQRVKAATMNRAPAKMAWTDFSHVADFFPDPPRTGEALNRVLFDIGRLLRIRQEKLMRGLQKAGAGRLLLILDYLLGKGEVIRQPEAYFETMLRA